MSDQVAVIGAGMAGAACARALADVGMTVRVFDNGRSIGGRMAQRRVPAGTFDHGAQYLTVRDPAFIQAVASWRQLGLVSDWPEAEGAAGRLVLVGVPAMNAPVKALLDGMDVSCGSRAVRLASTSGEWMVHLEDGPAHGPFGSLVLAIPAPQAAELLATAGFGRITELIVQLGSARIAPCWSALAAFDRRLPLDNATLRGEGPLAWAARNGTKPGRGDGEAWTLHARPAWSAERLEWRSEEVAPMLLREFAAAVGFQTPEPSYLQAHRWRYALVERPMGRSCVWDPALRLGMCGDWCLGPRVEAAFLSGRAMAAALANAGAPL